MGDCYRVSEKTDSDGPTYCLKTVDHPIDEFYTNPQSIDVDTLVERAREAEDGPNIDTYARKTALYFQIEIHCLIALQAIPGIPKIYNWGNLNGAQNSESFLLCEEVPGTKLLDTMRKEDLPLKTKIEIIQRTAEIMQKIHNKDILHRDIKPSNIMWDQKTNAVHVIDLGLASYLNNNETLLHPEKVGRIIGSPAYLAPEQAFGDNKEVGKHTDIFNLGASLYHLLTGEIIHVGDNPFALITSARGYEYHNPLTPSPFPKKLDQALSKALAKKPQDRYASMQAFADDLKAFAESLEAS